MIGSQNSCDDELDDLYIIGADCGSQKWLFPTAGAKRRVRSLGIKTVPSRRSIWALWAEGRPWAYDDNDDDGDDEFGDEYDVDVQMCTTRDLASTMQSKAAPQNCVNKLFHCTISEFRSKSVNWAAKKIILFFANVSRGRGGGQIFFLG